MGARWKHFKTIMEHKLVVYQECKACGIGWQGFWHDMSKFGRTEFASSAKYFQGDKSPIEQEKALRGYSVAWLHHKGHNPHHWEWWIDFDANGKIIANKIPSNYVIEMICDWIGAGKVYSKEKWDQHEPYNYYMKVRKGRYFHPETENLILDLLEIIDQQGLDDFHRICKRRVSPLSDYDGGPNQWIK